MCLNLEVYKHIVQCNFVKTLHLSDSTCMNACMASSMQDYKLYMVGLPSDFHHYHPHSCLAILSLRLSCK